MKRWVGFGVMADNLIDIGREWQLTAMLTRRRRGEFRKFNFAPESNYTGNTRSHPTLFIPTNLQGCARQPTTEKRVSEVTSGPGFEDLSRLHLSHRYLSEAHRTSRA